MTATIRSPLGRSLSGRLLRNRLLIGASLATLTLAGVAQAQENLGARRVVDPSVAAAQAAQSTATRNAQAEAAAARTRASFEAASRARAQMDAAQNAARQAALLAQSNVPNGLGAGGLQAANGVPVDPSLWVGAKGPTQSQGANGRTNVVVDQTQEKAILTWDSFNVGRETDLTFDHHGNTSWMTLNRITDASADPTKILGSIKAAGSVYIINPNGVIFGGASQVNVRNLIASTLEIHGGFVEWFRPAEGGVQVSEERWAELKKQARDQKFMNGLFGANAQDDNGDYRGTMTFWDGVTSGLTQEELAAEVDNAAQSTVSGITVAKGARIEAATSGMVVLTGRNVDNSGTISAPSGQVLLAAGRGLTMIEGTGRKHGGYIWAPDSQTDAELVKIAGYIGVVQQGGRTSNDGLLLSTRGNVSLVGGAVKQDGVIAVTTAIDKVGTIILDGSSMSGLSGGDPNVRGDPVGVGDRRGSVTIGGSSHMSILPDDSSQTAPGSVFTASTVDIVGNQIVFEQGSTLWAPGGKLYLTADGVNANNGAANQTPGRIYIDSGAMLDVSGLNGVEIGMEQNSVRAELRANELANNPVVRDGVLRGETVYFDGRLGEKLTDGSGIGKLSGWYDLIQRDVSQFMTVGGSVTMKGAEIITREGSRIDLSGGSVQYKNGYVRSTRLIDAYGRIVPIEQAIAGVKYVGVEGDTVINHARWGVTERFENPFGRASQGSWQQGYVEGRSAGALTIHAGTVKGAGNIKGMLYTGDLARIFDGTVDAGVIVGDYQREAPTGASVTDVSRIWRERPSLGKLTIGEVVQVGFSAGLNGGDIVIADKGVALGKDFTADSVLFDADARFKSVVDGVTPGRHILSSDWFDGKTFGTVTIHSGDSITGLYTQSDGAWVLKNDAPASSQGGILTIGEGVAVDLGDHGSFTFIGRQARIDGTIRAAGGKVSLEGTWLPKLSLNDTVDFNSIPDALRPGVTLGTTGLIDVAGRWTNHYLDSLNGGALSPSVVDGGSVRLFGYRVHLDEGSLIDVSAGARLATDGKTLTLGNGGSVTLDADTATTIGLQVGGGLQLEGKLAAYAPGKGGTLTINSDRAVIVGNRPVVGEDDRLIAGQPAPASSILGAELDLPAGTPLPIALPYSYVIEHRLEAGQTLESDTYLQNPSFTIAAGWTLPDTVYGVYDQNFGFYPSGSTVPAGTIIGYVDGYFAAGYTLPSDAFPNGISLGAETVNAVHAPGTILDTNVIYAAGTAVPIDTVFMSDVVINGPRRFTSDFFTQAGFANFGLSGARGLTVTSGTVIAPTVDTLQLSGAVRDLATGARLFDQVATAGSGIGLINSADLPQWQGQATDLVLSSQPSAFTGFSQQSGWALFSSTTRPTTVSIEAGSEIRLAAESRVLLNSTQRLFVDGRIEVPGGDIVLQNSGPSAYTGSIDVVVGDNARLLARGYQATDYVDGQAFRHVAGGGRLAIGASSIGSESHQRVVVGAGALLDVSGVAGFADLQSASEAVSRTSPPFEAVSVDGAGGSIIVNANGGVIAGNLRLAAGGETGLGGRLAFYGGERGHFVINGALNADPVTQESVAPTGLITLSADRISASGADDLSIGGVTPYSFRDSQIAFQGDVRLSARRSVMLEAKTFLAGSQPPEDGGTPDDTHVSIESAYVRLVGAADGAAAHPGGIAERNSFSVKAGLIDVMNGVSLGSADGGDGFATADFDAKGDIRLLATREASTGGLASAGAIRFLSAQTYVAPSNTYSSGINEAYEQFDPAENNDGFLVNSPISVEVRSNGAPAAVPMTWGGKLTLRAPEILQAGVLRAPLGTIVLDAVERVDDEGNRVSGRLTLASGSLTSVSLEGKTALAGLVTSNQQFNGYAREDWSPSKALVLSGSAVDLQNGAVVDLTGGGDLLGYSFASGAKGTTNILNDDSADGAFAILPGYDGPTAVPVGARPLDGQAGWFSSNPGNNTSGYRSGTSDERLRVGDQVYLAGVKGLADGYYTLLPAAFALHQGGMLVKPVDSVLHAGALPAQDRDDGSEVVSGYRAIAGTAIRPDQGWSSFQVMDGKTWRQYSDITTYGFNAIRSATNAANGLSVRTPHDAGRLVIQASEQLTLLGQARLAGGGPGATAGVAGDVDISNPGGGLALVDSGQTAPEGYLAVTTQTAQSFAGAGSLLLGGRRAITTRVAGDANNPDTFPKVADGIALRTTAADVLIADGVTYTGLELLLAATGTIIVGDGAQLRATGTSRTSGADLLTEGGGALLRLSSGSRVGLVRTAGSNPSGHISIGSGAELKTDGALSLDATGGFALASSALLDVGSLDLASDRINIGDTPDDVLGTVISLETIERLAGASNLLLRGHQTIALWGDFALGGRGADGKATLSALSLDAPIIEGHPVGEQGPTITAGTLTLRNSGASATAQTGTGALTLDVDRLLLSGGSVDVGYAALRGRVGALRAEGAGALSMQGAADLSVGRVEAATGAAYALRTTGALALRQGQAIQGGIDGLGGTLNFTGASVLFDTALTIPAGSVGFEATAGDVTIGEHAKVEVTGMAKDFVDTVRLVPGGVVKLTASGDVVTHAASLIDVSGHARGGAAGVIDVIAGGDARLDGKMLASTAKGYAGGEFSLDADEADFAALNAKLNAGLFTASRDIRLDQTITLAAGDRIEAHQVLLRSDGGDVRIAGVIAAAGDEVNARGGTVRLTGANVSLDGTARIEAGAANVAAGDFQPASATIVLAADLGRVDFASGASIALAGGREGGGRLTVRAARTDGGADAGLDGTVTGAREKILVGSRVYDAEIVDAPLVGTALNDANIWLTGATVPAGWDKGAGIVIRSSGDLTVADDIDLSGISGPGYLGLEAGGDLVIKANVSDGFDGATKTTALGEDGSFSFGLEAGRDIIVGEFPPPPTQVFVAGGQPIDKNRPLSDAMPFVVAADWIVPDGMYVATSDGQEYWTGRSIPGGSTIVASYGEGFAAGYILPADVFPDGIAFPIEKAPFTGEGRIVRTGTGDIDVRAGRDLQVGAESAIYTAGRATDTATGFDRASYVSERTDNTERVLGDFPTQGGNLSLTAGRDIKASPIEQTPTAWLFRYGESSWNGNPADSIVFQQTSWSILFRNYQFGVGALGGGDISVRARGDITDLAAALPTTGHMTTAVGDKVRTGDLIVRGGGDLRIRALDDIAGGHFVLGNGRAILTAGGSVTGGASTQVVVGAEGQVQGGGGEFETRGIAPLFSLMDAQVSVQAARGVEIEGSYDLGLVPQVCENIVGSCIGIQGDGSAWVAVSARSALDALGGGGNVLYHANSTAAVTLTRENRNDAFRVWLSTPTPPSNNSPTNFVQLLDRSPATMRLASVGGDLRLEGPVKLSASPIGTLELLAGGSLEFDTSATIELEDRSAEYIRNAYQPVSTEGQVWASISTLNSDFYATIANNFYRGYRLSHADDLEPVRLYALNGSIGTYDGTIYDPWRLLSPKAVRVQAGGDVGIAALSITHNRATDLSTVIAGRNIYGASLNSGGGMRILGDGNLWVEAGGNLLHDLGAGAFISGGNGSAGGQDALLANAGGPRYQTNYALPDVGADIHLVAGTAQGADFTAFANLYLDPSKQADSQFGLSHASNQGKVVQTYQTELDEFLKARGFPEVTDQNRRDLFDSLPQQTREGFLQNILVEELRQTGVDYNKADSPRFKQYTRGYDALHLLYPETEGLGRNNPLGGDLILRNSRVESVSGGSINLIAPYGRISIGDPIDPVVPRDAGIVTRRGGDIAILANGTVSLDQSRVFTLQGGNLMMWTSNGDITAGVGAKTNVTNVPLSFLLNKSGLLSVNVFGLQTGAGIGVLDAFEGRDPNRKKSRMDLLAFFGEINAGDAGIRVVGDINIAALRVVNAANIEVSGEAVGIPQIPVVDVGALNAASSATTAIVNEAAQLAERSRPQTRTDIPTLVNVRFLGFGE